MTDAHDQELNDDWHELESDKAIAIGILSELTQIRRCLEAQTYGPGRMGEGRRRDRDGATGQDQKQDQPPTEPLYRCTSCHAVTVRGARAAQQHAVEEHNAPSDGETWRGLFEQVDGILETEDDP